MVTMLARVHRRACLARLLSPCCAREAWPPAGGSIADPQPQQSPQELAACSCSACSTGAARCASWQSCGRGMATVAPPAASTSSDLHAAEVDPQAPQRGARRSSQAQHQHHRPPEDWTQHTRTQFSIRPSLLSPLYSTYQGERRKEQRRQLISNLLDAHMLLSSEVDGLDAVQVERTAQHRAASLLQLSRDLLSLSTQRTNVAQCASKPAMLGFYSLMEKQLGSSQAAAAAAAANNAGAAGGGRSLGLLLGEGGREQVDDAQLFHDVANGKVSVWDAWRTQFVERYASAPSLPPLDEIYVDDLSSSSSSSSSASASSAGGALKPSSRAGGRLPLDLMDTNDRPKAAAAAAEAAGLQREQQLVALAGGFVGPNQGARMDVLGTVLAEGKRKSSVARVLVREGHGLVRVNGEPYDAFFPELLHRASMLQPLLALPHLATHFNVEATVAGGGKSAQAQAVRTALARALMLFRTKLRPQERHVLRPMVQWDRREVERMKPGQRGARASFTYVRR